MLQKIDSMFRNKWLASMPAPTLEAFYREKLGWKEAVLPHSKWHDGHEQHFFYNCIDKEAVDAILARIDSFSIDKVGQVAQAT